MKLNISKIKGSLQMFVLLGALIACVFILRFVSFGRLRHILLIGNAKKY